MPLVQNNPHAKMAHPEEDYSEPLQIHVCLYSSRNFTEENTVMCPLATGTHPEKCIVRQFHHCVNTRECTDTNQDGLAYYTAKLYGI